MIESAVPVLHDEVHTRGSVKQQYSVTVVIVNWNGAHHLDECLTALRSQTLAAETEVIVIDNGSTDGSIEVLDRYSESVRVIRNLHNVGFAAGCNQGIQARPSEFVALLNNDAIVEPTWLEELVKAMRRAPDIGSCTSKVLWYYDHGIFDNAGHVVYADGLTRGRGRLQHDSGQFEREEDVFAFSGCAALLRRSMLEDVGLFDEQFFAYCEEADLAFRARLRGWRGLYVPTAIAYHKFSASTARFSSLKALHVERNRFWLAVKNLPLPLLLASFGFTLVRYGWQVYGAFTGQGATGKFVREHSLAALAIIFLRAYGQALSGLSGVLRQRREIQARRTASTREVWTWLRRYGISARQMALLE
jgi:GT2 family glycosyltransferase